ncbi:MAG: (E)-4-hydroxy-3-methylbut-2-enyl-diphosphate synthase [Treponema sp.]|nr:(E)-4-hydroxy-3-methylbut-2-enyl-diphosphate synthase [Treponema sp.]
MVPHISKQVKIGGFDHASGHVEAVTIGGGFPPAIQTMWKDRLSELEGKVDDGKLPALIARINGLRNLGCRLLRFAVPDLESAEVLGSLASMVSMPLVADIHFDYKIALRCLDFPIAKIRINPGNIGPHGTPETKKKIEALLSKAAANSRPIRIGINAGSLPVDLRRLVESGSLKSPEALVEAAEREIAIFKEFGFKDVVVSMKASSITDTIKANRLFAERSDLPLHIGVTEAGPLIAGVVRSSAAILALLGDGIGDTIRVSLSDTMENEIIAAREILLAAEDMAAGMPASAGVRIISCPRCGRSAFDTHGFTERWLSRLYALNKNISVAIMGCAVNGPGEAKHADLGITGAGDKVLIFRKGEVIRTISEEEADAAFEEELEKL